MTDLRDRVDGPEGPLHRLLGHIPGFAGYREREQRRTADKLLREYLAGLLQETLGALRAVAGERARAAELTHLAALGRLTNRLEHATDQIRLADYGYSGWYDAVQVNDAELDRLYEYDLSLRQFIGDIAATVRALGACPDDRLPGQMAQVDEALGELQAMIATRERIVTQTMP